MPISSRPTTRKLVWDAVTNERQIEGAVIDHVHHELFNGKPPAEFAASYVSIRDEHPRTTLTKHRQNEIRTFLQRQWQGAGGVIVAEQMIKATVDAVLTHHNQRHSHQH